MRSFLEYLQVSYNDVSYENGEKWFGEDKKNLGLSFPNLPYLIDHENNANFTETLSIITYLCLKHDPSLLGGTVVEKGI